MSCTVITHARIASMQNPIDFELLVDGAVVIDGQHIAWWGPLDTLPAQYQNTPQFDAEGKLLTPGLIDCHTHLVWAGSRANEFSMRLHGNSYEEIANAGGGILATVRATRAATEDELYALALPRAMALINQGVTEIEIKSGYGLDSETELKQLRVARRLGQDLPIHVHTTFLAAHALAPEYQDDADAYIEHICEDMLPDAVAQEIGRAS